MYWCTSLLNVTLKAIKVVAFFLLLQCNIIFCGDDGSEDALSANKCLGGLCRKALMAAQYQESLLVSIEEIRELREEIKADELAGLATDMKENKVKVLQHEAGIASAYLRKHNTSSFCDSAFYTGEDGVVEFPYVLAMELERQLHEIACLYRHHNEKKRFASKFNFIIDAPLYHEDDDDLGSLSEDERGCVFDASGAESDSDADSDFGILRDNGLSERTKKWIDSLVKDGLMKKVDKH